MDVILSQLKSKLKIENYLVFNKEPASIDAVESILIFVDMVLALAKQKQKKS